MQSWQIKALELEASALNHLDGFIADHALYVFIGLVYLLIAFGIGLILLLRRSLKGKSVSHIRPVIFIDLPGPPPLNTDTFDPFPPPHHSAHCDCDDDYWE
jgi:hypothetical protein